MSETEIDVPAVGNVKREYVYAAVALVVGVGAYAWWKARGSSGGGGQLVVSGNDVIPATDRVTPGGGGNDGPTNVDGTNGKIVTNAQWTSYVVDKIASYGIDPAAASGSLGKWLSHSTSYTAADVEAIQRAVGLAGYPPEGAPWTIPAAPTAPPTPTNTTFPTPPAGLDPAGSSPYFHLTAKPEETWYQITERAYGFDRLDPVARQNEMTRVARVTNEVRRMNLNAGVKGDYTGPAAGEYVWFH